MQQQMMALCANLLILFLEFAGLRISISDRKWKVLAYYTQISNMFTALASLGFVLLGQRPAITTLRFTSASMLTMTCLISIFAPASMSEGFKKMMLSGNGIYHHTFCPILSVASYLLWEAHIPSTEAILLPAAITLLYGLSMVWVNAKGYFTGPYFFFEVRRMKAYATALWMSAIMVFISLTGYGLYRAPELF